MGVRMDDSIQSIEIGKGEVVREGEDVVILALGSTVFPSLHGAEQLEKAGIRAAVINCRFLKPLDEDLLCHWAKKTGNVLTVEENILQGGFGSAVLELFQERNLFSIRVKRLGIPDLFVENGPQSFLRAEYGIDENSIVREVIEMVRNPWKDGVMIRGR
jgi:1-deoxy-D-xylulose-5-phosphate synthase